MSDQNNAKLEALMIPKHRLNVASAFCVLLFIAVLLTIALMRNNQFILLLVVLLLFIAYYVWFCAFFLSKYRISQVIKGNIWQQIVYEKATLPKPVRINEVSGLDDLEYITCIKDDMKTLLDVAGNKEFQAFRKHLVGLVGNNGTRKLKRSETARFPGENAVRGNGILSASLGNVVSPFALNGFNPDEKISTLEADLMYIDYLTEACTEISRKIERDNALAVTCASLAVAHYKRYKRPDVDSDTELFYRIAKMCALPVAPVVCTVVRGSNREINPYMFTVVVPFLGKAIEQLMKTNSALHILPNKISIEPADYLKDIAVIRHEYEKRLGKNA